MLFWNSVDGWSTKRVVGNYKTLFIAIMSIFLALGTFKNNYSEMLEKQPKSCLPKTLKILIDR